MLQKIWIEWGYMEHPYTGQSVPVDVYMGPQGLVVGPITRVLRIGPYGAQRMFVEFEVEFPDDD
jgi:hypothetical protein